MRDDDSRGPMLVGLVCGAPFLAFGGYQVISRNLDITGIAVWMAGGVALHDFLLVPLVFAVGAMIRRRARGRMLAPVEAALVATGILVLFAVPALSGKGRSAADPSRVPGDYPVALAVLVAMIWIAAGAWYLLDNRRGRP